MSTDNPFLGPFLATTPPSKATAKMIRDIQRELDKRAKAESRMREARWILASHKLDRRP